MSDKSYIAIFVALGLVVAYVVSAPLRKSDADEPRIGTPLREAQMQKDEAATGEVYAEGTITSAASGGMLFIIARAEERGAPLAAQRVPNPTFPYSYKLTTADNTAGEGFYGGALKIIARLDADGVAGPKQPEDREAIASISEGGSRKVDLSIR